MPAPRYPAKIATPATRSRASRALPRPLVFTNGVFDILHRGHVTYLEQARALGASLVVAVNSDASVRRLGKAPDRPLNPLDDRMAVLAALAAVDLVVPFDDDTPRELIVACLPDVLVKGGDYTAETTAGAAEVIAAGGRFVAIPFATTRSTTALIAKIRGYVTGSRRYLLVAVEEVADDPLLAAVDRRIERAVGRIVLLRLAERVDRVLVVALRLQRLAEAAPRLGVGELEIGPRAAELGGAAPVAGAQHARAFGLQHGDAWRGARRTARRRRRRAARAVAGAGGDGTSAVASRGCRRSRR